MDGACWQWCSLKNDLTKPCLGEPPKNLSVSLSFLDFLYSLRKILFHLLLWQYMSYYLHPVGWERRLEVSIFTMQKFHLLSLISTEYPCVFCFLLFCGVWAWCLYFMLYTKSAFRLLPCKTGTITQIYGEKDRLLETNCLNTFLNQFSCF